MEHVQVANVIVGQVHHEMHFCGEQGQILQLAQMLTNWRHLSLGRGPCTALVNEAMLASKSRRHLLPVAFSGCLCHFWLGSDPPPLLQCIEGFVVI